MAHEEHNSNYNEVQRKPVEGKPIGNDDSSQTIGELQGYCSEYTPIKKEYDTHLGNLQVKIQELEDYIIHVVKPIISEARTKQLEVSGAYNAYMQAEKEVDSICECMHDRQQEFSEEDLISRLILQSVINEESFISNKKSVSDKINTINEAVEEIVRRIKDEWYGSIQC